MSEEVAIYRPNTDIIAFEEIKKALRAPTPKKERRTRAGPGGMRLTYAPWSYVADRLNEVFGPNWSFESIVEPKMHDGQVIVGVRLVTPLGHQDAFGGHKYMPNNPNASYADALQSAMSKALRRAAARWGIALDLYRGDEETRDEDEDVVAARVALESALKTFGIAKADALAALGTKSFGEAVMKWMEDAGEDEPTAIWHCIQMLIKQDA
mgnify:CR=1 FL=1